MPFRALDDGKVVTPTQVDDQQPVECPECRGILYPRDGKHRARHFFHTGDDAAESCSMARQGASDIHARCTALAVATLADQYPNAARVDAGITIDATGTPTTPETRRADALVEFNEKNPFFGRGLIIEVQHKHHSKDIEGTTHDYLSAGYSVAWLESEDFGDEHLDYQVVNDAFRSDDGRAFSIREYDPWGFDTRVEANLDWEEKSRGCHFVEEYGSHSWSQVPGYAHPDGYEYEYCWWCGSRRRYDHEYCWWCGSRRRYDHELTRFVYDYEGVLAPEVDIEVLRDAVIPYPDVADDFDDWKNGDSFGRERSFEEALAKRTDVAPCRGPHDIHEWRRKEVIERRYDDRVDVALRECRHCPVHLLTNHAGQGETEAAILFGKAPDPGWGLDHLNGNPRNCNNTPHREQADWDYCPDCFQIDP